MLKIIITVTIISLFSSCSSLGLFGTTLEKAGTAAESAGKGIGIARVGSGVKSAGKALENRSKAKILEQKVKQVEAQKKAEVAKQQIKSNESIRTKEIESKTIAKKQQLLNEAKTTSAVVDFLSKTKGATQTLALAKIAQSVKEKSLEVKTEQAIQEAKFEYQTKKEEYNKEIVIAQANATRDLRIAEAKSKFSFYTGIPVGLILMAFIIFVLLLLRVVQSKEFTIK